MLYDCCDYDLYLYNLLYEYYLFINTIYIDILISQYTYTYILNIRYEAISKGVSGLCRCGQEQQGHAADHGLSGQPFPRRRLALGGTLGSAVW